MSQTPVVSDQGLTGAIVARGGTGYRVKRYIMVVVLLVYGGLSLWDGFYAWRPEHWAVTHPNEKEKTAADILFNEVLGVGLPPLAMLLLVWTLYNSRGELRLENGVMSVPGHPPVPLEAIVEMDRALWDRKGIAKVSYDVGGEKGTFRLDDFVYDAKGIGEMFKVIEGKLVGK